MVSDHHIQYQKKRYDPILRKLRDRWMERQTDRRTDGSDFIRGCLTNVERTKISLHNSNKNYH